MKSFACLLFLLPTLALAQDYLGHNHPRVWIYANGNDYISNVVGDIIASRSRGETRVDRANNYAREQAYADAVANLAALRAHQAATEPNEIDANGKFAGAATQAAITGILGHAETLREQALTGFKGCREARKPFHCHLATFRPRELELGLQCYRSARSRS